MGLGLTQYLPLIAYLMCIVVFFSVLLYDAKIGLYLITLLIPLQNLMEKLIEFPFGKDIFDILVIALLIRVLLSGRDKAVSFHEKKTNKLILLIIPFTYSALWVGSFKLGQPFPISLENHQLVQWKNFIMMPILYFITFNLIKDKKQMVMIVSIIVLTLFLMDANYYQNTRWYSHENFTYDKRAIGSTFTYLGPNEIASFYAQTSMFFVGLILCSGFGIRQIIYFGVTCFTFYPIMFLYSRGAYAALLVSFAFFGFAKKKIILVLLIVLLISWQAILPNAVVERIEMTSGESGMDTSVTSRFDLWKDALSNIVVNPVTGLGFGSTRLLGFKTGGDHKRDDVHNGYIEILLEQGFLGLFIFLNIFIIGIKKGWDLFRKSDDEFFRGLGLGFVGMVIASLVSNMFGDRWSYLNVMGYFWILLGLVMKANQLERVKSDEAVSA